MRSNIFWVMILVTVTALLFGGTLAAGAKTRMPTVVVPVLLISERPKKSTRFVIDYQRYQGPSVWYGILHVPNPSPQNSVDELVAWGCEANEQADQLTDEKLAEQFSQFHGNIASYGSAKGIFDEDPFVLANADYRKRSFFEVMQQFKSQCQKTGCIVFVHGCCISLKDAAKESAELSVRFRMPVICFDWDTPTGWWLPELNPYHKSERAFEMSQLIFDAFMEKLTSEVAREKVVLVGHSMGSRMIENNLYHSSSPNGKFNEVHFVNADMSLPAYLEQEPRICDRAGSVYVYTSDRDVAMKASQILSVNVVRTGRPEGFLDFYTCVKDFSLPKNRYFINLSELRTNSTVRHGIPFEVLSVIHNQGPHASTNSWKIIPSSTEKGHGNLLKLQYSKEKQMVFNDN